jgi:hypothetical protein
MTAALKVRPGSDPALHMVQIVDAFHARNVISREWREIESYVAA